MFANQMFPAVLGIFMVVLVQDLGFPGWMWGVLFFLPRVFDAITDPIMGYISDNTRIEMGKKKTVRLTRFDHYWNCLYPYVAIVSREMEFDYNFILFPSRFPLLFYLGLTIFSVPYVAMGYEISNDFHERTSIMAVAQCIGQWAWVIAPWFWVFMYETKPGFQFGRSGNPGIGPIGVGIVCMLFLLWCQLFF